jgi:hypothetical protein
MIVYDMRIGEMDFPQIDSVKKRKLILIPNLVDNQCLFSQWSKAIARRWPKVKSKHVKLCNHWGAGSKGLLGQTQYIMVQQNKTFSIAIANMFAQNKKFLLVPKLKTCMVDVQEFCKNPNWETEIHYIKLNTQKNKKLPVFYEHIINFWCKKDIPVFLFKKL